MILILAVVIGFNSIRPIDVGVFGHMIFLHHKKSIHVGWFL
jgi:hypothetical protein